MKGAEQIQYSDKYSDELYEYRLDYNTIYLFMLLLLVYYYPVVYIFISLMIGLKSLTIIEKNVTILLTYFIYLNAS